MENDMEFEDVAIDVAPLDMPSAPIAEEPKKSADRLSAELEAYKRHFSALQSDLETIEQEYQQIPSDNANALEKRVSGVEKGIEEIKQMLQQKNNAPQPQIYYPPQPQIPYPQIPSVYSTPSPVIPPLVTYR